MAESRRERERVLADYRKQADEKKDFKEKVEKRVRCYPSIYTISLSNMSSSSSASHPPTTLVDRVS